MADEIKYEYKTVQTVRGTDGLVISKMQKDGWELVEQAQGMLRSTLDFRRPKKPLPRLLIGTAVGGLVILAIVIGVARHSRTEARIRTSRTSRWRPLRGQNRPPHRLRPWPGRLPLR